MKKIYTADLLAGTLKSVEVPESQAVSEDRQRALHLTDDQAEVYISKKLTAVADAGFGSFEPILRQLLFNEEHAPGFWTTAASLIARHVVVVAEDEL